MEIWDFCKNILRGVASYCYTEMLPDCNLAFTPHLQRPCPSHSQHPQGPVQRGAWHWRCTGSMAHPDVVLPMKAAGAWLGYTSQLMPIILVYILIIPFPSKNNNQGFHNKFCRSPLWPHKLRPGGRLSGLTLASSLPFWASRTWQDLLPHLHADLVRQGCKEGSPCVGFCLQKSHYVGV